VARSLRFLAVVLITALAPAARAEMLPDSTVREAWKLPNGLEVRTLHVPGAAGVSVTVAYRAGSAYEPAGLEGLSDLLAEVYFTAAAGDVPERTREEMPSLRPLAGNPAPARDSVRFTEIATPAQLPGVMLQLSHRMGGVRVDDAAVKRALASVRRDRGARYFGEPADGLYWRTAAIARGVSDEQLVRISSLTNLDRIGAKDLAPWLQRWYHAGNASIAIVGNLSGVDVHKVVTTLFGPLAGGTALPDTVEVRPQGRAPGLDVEIAGSTGGCGRVLLARAHGLAPSQLLLAC
jgi:zinc protease